MHEHSRSRASASRSARRGLTCRVAPFAAAAAIGVAALAGCGSSSSSSSSSNPPASSASTDASSSTTAASSSSSSSPSTDVNAYLQAIKSQPHFQGLSDANLTKLGNAVCSDFDQGNSLNQTEQDSLQAINEINANDAESGNNAGGNLDQHDAGFLIGAAVKGLCPQHSDQLPSS